MLRPISLEAAKFLLCPFTIKGLAIYKYFYHNDELLLLHTYVDGPNLSITLDRHVFEQCHMNWRTQFYRFEPVPQYVQDAVECGIEIAVRYLGAPKILEDECTSTQKKLSRLRRRSS